MPCVCPTTETGVSTYVASSNVPVFSPLTAQTAFTGMPSLGMPSILPVFAQGGIPLPPMVAPIKEVLDLESGTFVPPTEPKADPLPEAIVDVPTSPYEAQIGDVASVPPKRDMVPILLAGAGILGLIFLLRGSPAGSEG